MFQITDHFKCSEFSCHCGCGDMRMDRDYVAALEKLRVEYGKPIVVTSGFRCKQHNKAVGGADNSMHVEGLACDISVITGADRFQIVYLAIKHGFTGIGISTKFVHLDRRVGVPVIWTY